MTSDQDSPDQSLLASAGPEFRSAIHAYSHIVHQLKPGQVACSQSPTMLSIFLYSPHW